MAGPRPDLKAAMRAALEKKQMRVAVEKPAVETRADGAAVAARLRQEGNKLFAANDLAGAEERYRAALGQPQPGEASSILWSNLALLRIAARAWSEGLTMATRALADDGTNVKARYRRALCAAELGRAEEALADVAAALERLDASTPEAWQARDLQARVERMHAAAALADAGSERSSLVSEDWELCGAPPAEDPEPLRAAYAAPPKDSRRYDSSTSIPTVSDYFHVEAADDRYVRAPREAAARGAPVTLEEIMGVAEGCWPGNPDEDHAPPPGTVVRQIGVIPSVPEPEAGADDDADEDNIESEDMRQAAALLAFCDRKREKETDESMARWRKRWGD